MAPAKTAFIFLLVLGAAPAWAAKPARSGEANAPEAWIAQVEQAEKRLSEQWSLLVMDLETSRTILAYHADERLMPASNRKIVVFALALEKLGPEFRFKTELGYTGTLDGQSGTINGALVLRSNGDPTLESRYLNQKNPAAILRGWVAGLRRSGIRRIRGNCVIDASAFGQEQDQYPEAWDPSYRSHGYAMPASAIALNNNLVRVSVKPAASLGGTGKVSLFPSAEGINVDNQTQTAPGSPEGLDGKFDERGRTLTLTGRIGQEIAEHVVSVPLAAPLESVRALMKSALEDEGIQVGGKTVILTDRVAAAEYRSLTPLAWHDSIPLIELLRIMLRNSDNFLAEQLWRATAWRATGDGGIASARRLEQAWYAEHGLPWAEPGYDGAGLSRHNRVAASEMVGILEAIYASPYRPYLLDCLPSSGVSGTLRGRTMGADAGRIVAKTGTLAGTSALSGFVRDKQRNPRWAFALLANAPGDTNGRLTARGDQIMKILVGMLDSGGKGSPPTAPVMNEKKYKPGTKRYVGNPS